MEEKDPPNAEKAMMSINICVISRIQPEPDYLEDLSRGSNLLAMASSCRLFDTSTAVP